MRKGDGKTVGCIVGEQFANLPIGSGGLGTIKVVGKGLDDASGKNTNISGVHRTCDWWRLQRQITKVDRRASEQRMKVRGSH